jgi:hypothetical protein
VLTESVPFGGFLLSEANGYRSRENGILAQGQKLPAGAVVGRITTGGKIAEYNSGLSNGTETAVGILLGAIDATDGDQPCVFIANDAEVKRDGLAWRSGADDTEKNAGIAALAAAGIRIKARV